MFGWALFGGPGEIRTHDLFHAMEARSQLRHRPMFQCGKELSLRSQYSTDSVTLHIHDLLQRVLNFHQFPAVLHYFIDVLISSGYFIDETRP